LEKRCRKCNQILVPKVNWFPSHEKNGNYICHSCYYNQRKIWERKTRQRPKAKEYARDYRRKKREEIIKLLGNKCSNPNCPIPEDKLDIRILEIDHVKGNGNKERASFPTTWAYYKFVFEQIKLGSKRYQSLCPYCNALKRKKIF
jgi:hypothetical protein